MKKFIATMLLCTVVLLCSCDKAKKENESADNPQSESETSTVQPDSAETEGIKETESETEPESQTEKETEKELTSEEKLIKDSSIYLNSVKQFIENEEKAYRRIYIDEKHKPEVEKEYVVNHKYVHAKNGDMTWIKADYGEDGKYNVYLYAVGNTLYFLTESTDEDKSKEMIAEWYKCDLEDGYNAIEKNQDNPMIMNTEEIEKYLDSEDVSYRQDGNNFIITFRDYETVKRTKSGIEIGNIDYAADVTVIDENGIPEEIETITTITDCTFYISTDTKLVNRIKIEGKDWENIYEVEWEYESMTVPEEGTKAIECSAEEIAEKYKMAKEKALTVPEN